jgi:uncharacterized Zn finger protein (UPF0148 family)
MTMPFLLPSAEELDNAMEDPNAEGGIRPTPESVTTLIGRALLQGHTMLAGSCDACNTVLMRSPQGAEYCVYCQMRDQTARNEAPIQSTQPAHSAQPQHPLRLAMAQAQPLAVPQVPEEVLAQRRARRDRIANFISAALSNGHAMLNTLCPACQTVMLRCVARRGDGWPS